MVSEFKFLKQLNSLKIELIISLACVICSDPHMHCFMFALLTSCEGEAYTPSLNICGKMKFEIKLTFQILNEEINGYGQLIYKMVSIELLSLWTQHYLESHFSLKKCKEEQHLTPKLSMFVHYIKTLI